MISLIQLKLSIDWQRQKKHPLCCQHKFNRRCCHPDQSSQTKKQTNSQRDRQRQQLWHWDMFLCDCWEVCESALHVYDVSCILLFIDLPDFDYDPWDGGREGSSLTALCLSSRGHTHMLTYFSMDFACVALIMILLYIYCIWVVLFCRVLNIRKYYSGNMF